MKKWVFLSFFLIVSLGGCTSKTDDSRQTITYLTMESLPEQRRALKEMVEKFEQRYPDIHVKVEFSNSGFQKLKIRIAGGDAPDVFYNISDRMPALVLRDAILNLTPFVERDEEVSLEKYFPESVQSCLVNKDLYLFPFHFSTDLLFYNKDLFDESGVAYPNSDWTWNDFLEAAKKLTKREKKRVLQYGTLQPRTLLMIRSFGGECFDPTLKEVLIDSPETREALTFLVDLEKRHQVTPTPGQLRDIDKEDGLELFSSGKVAMFVGRTYMVTEFTKIDRFSWDVAPVPLGAKRYSRLAVGGNCISKTTQNPEAAWKFVKFYSGEVGSRICGLSRNCVPALESIARSPLFLYSPPNEVQILIDAIKYSQIENYGLLNWDEFFLKSFKIETDKVLFHAASISESLKAISREGMLALKEDASVRKQ